MHAFRATAYACLGALILTNSPSDAAQAKRKAKPKSARASKPVMSDTEFLATELALNRYEDLDSLKACGPRDFMRLAIALKANRDLLTTEQGEFETTDAFLAREEKLRNVLSGSSMAVCESLANNDDAPFKYDADRQRFEGSILSDHNVWRDTKDLGSYRSKTRMGIPMTVKASVNFEYDISLEFPDTENGCVRDTAVNKYYVPVPIDKAPATKAAGKIAYIVRLVRPYALYRETEGQASLDYPYDESLIGITVMAKLEQVIVTGLGGEVLWQCEIK